MAWQVCVKHNQNNITKSNIDFLKKFNHDFFSVATKKGPKDQIRQKMQMSFSVAAIHAVFGAKSRNMPKTNAGS
jgi:hypothetical protein